MRLLVLRHFKSKFAKNVILLGSATTLSQLINLAISPVLTRVYTPDEFGYFATFLSVVAILASISTGGYTQAIMLPKKN